MFVFGSLQKRAERLLDGGLVVQGVEGSREVLSLRIAIGSCFHMCPSCAPHPQQLTGGGPSPLLSSMLKKSQMV